MISGPARGRRNRARSLRAVSPCLALALALVTFDLRFAEAQTLTTALLRPVRDGFVSPQESPLRRTSEEELAAWASSGKPVVALVPEFDDYLRPEEAARRFATIGQAEVVGVPGGKHLWVGQAETVLDEIVKRVAPAAYPLPRDWAGPMEYGDSLAYADRTVPALTEKEQP